jgi:hypothetical protein
MVMFEGLNKIDRAADRVESAVTTVWELFASVCLIVIGVVIIAATFFVLHIMAPGRPLRSLPMDGLWTVIVFVVGGASFIWQGFRGIVANLKPKPKAPAPTRPGRW